MFYGYLAAKGSWHGEAGDLEITWRKNFHTFFFSCRGGRSVILGVDWQLWCAQLPLMRQQMEIGDRLCGSVVSQGPGHVLGYNPPNGQTVLTVQWALSHTFIGHRRTQSIPTHRWDWTFKRPAASSGQCNTDPHSMLVLASFKVAQAIRLYHLFSLWRQFQELA